MPNISLNLLVIRSADITQAAQFYSLFGLEFTLHHHGNGPEHYACDLGSLVFEIYPCANESQTTTATRLGFQVPSLDSLIVTLQANGTKIISTPQDSPWGRRAVIADPDGHRVELVEQM